MNWIGRKIHLYNVTMGLYMLDWWERYLFKFYNSYLRSKLFSAAVGRGNPNL